MPIYEYECKDCGEIFEVFLSSSDKPVKKCECCNSTKIQKLISNCSFQLKGTGWYATDYANKDKNSRVAGKKKDDNAAKESSSSLAADTKASGSSDSAADKKTAGAAATKAA